MPNTQFFVQNATIPDISSGVTEQMTPFKTIYRPGDKVQFGDLTVQIAIDENLGAYLDAWNWLISLTKPEGFEQYESLEKGDGIYSDATLTLLTSGKNPNVEFTFIDMFPSAVGGIPLDITNSVPTVPTTDITFRYSSYKIKLLS
jgi:hypothetical protein